MGTALARNKVRKRRDGEDTDVSHQEAVCISVLEGVGGWRGAGRLVMLSRLIYLIGSQDAYKSVALWVSMWLISPNCALAKLFQ